MSFDLDESVTLLRRTPAVVDSLLRDLPATWLEQDEGPGTWTPVDVVRHLVHTDDEDWLPRTRRLLDDIPWDPFDPSRFAEHAGNRSLAELLDHLAAKRHENLDALEELQLSADDLERTTNHPSFGPVHLRQHLATWVAHDLDHLRQIARTLALRHREAIGPWTAFLTVMD